MGYSEGPGLQGTSLVKEFQTSPQLKVNFLSKIAALIGVGLITGRQPIQRHTKLRHCVFIQRLLH